MTSTVLTNHETPRRPGRPRSETTRRNILEATIHLLERQSVQSLTIEAIARRAGVGKATIYRWWDSKALVVIDAFIEHHIIRTPMPRDLPPADALAIHFTALVHEYAGWSGRIVAQIIAEGQSDPAVLREFRERFHYGRRAVVREVLEQWRGEGSIPAPTDIEVLGDLIYAPVYMRLLLGHSPLDDAFVRSHLAYVYWLLGAPIPTAQDG
ncbi:MAG TPA: TetR/AcrR family transcriptional regulator, partial [Ilumatobacteraceae bacterium]